MESQSDRLAAVRETVLSGSLEAIGRALPRLLPFVETAGLREKFAFLLDQVERIMREAEVAVDRQDDHRQPADGARNADSGDPQDVGSVDRGRMPQRSTRTPYESVDRTSPGYTLARELGRLGAASGLDMEELIEATYCFRHALWTYLETHPTLLAGLSHERLLRAIRKINEYLSSVNLAIGHEYLTKEREVVATQRAFLSRQQEQLDAELKLARQIQQSMFPPRCDYRAFKSCAKMQAAGAVGGDFYDVVHFGAPLRRVDVYIGDVQGKGVPAALLTMMMIAVLRDIAGARGAVKEILTETNRRIRQDIREELTQFVSLFYLSYAVEDREIRYGKAGHEDGFLVRGRTPGASGELISLSAAGQLLGVFDEVEYEEKRLPVAPGDRLYLFTDGVTAHRGPNDAPFDSEAFASLLLRYDRYPINRTLDGIFEELADLRGGGPLKDDLAILVVEF